MCQVADIVSTSNKRAIVDKSSSCLVGLTFYSSQSSRIVMISKDLYVSYWIHYSDLLFTARAIPHKPPHKNAIHVHFDDFVPLPLNDGHLIWYPGYKNYDVRVMQKNLYCIKNCDGLKSV